MGAFLPIWVSKIMDDAYYMKLWGDCKPFSSLLDKIGGRKA